MSTKLSRIAEKARQDKKTRFTSLAHIITPEFLQETWKRMNRKGASGVDGETTKEFESQLVERTKDIWHRLRDNRYKAPPVRRVEIPKGNGKTRPLGIPTVDRVHDWLKKHSHWKRRDQQRQLSQMLTGFYQYFSLHHCKPKLEYIRSQVQLQWIRSLRRRSQRHRLYWSYLSNRSWFELPYPTLLHSNV